MLLVFDLDGTLVDSRRDLADSTNEVVAAYGGAPLPVASVAAMVGDGARALVERALAAAGVDAPIEEALDRFREVYDRRLLVHTRPYDGVAAALARARGRAILAVLTNKPEAPARRLLEAFGFAACFGRVIGGDSGFARKPDPAGLRHLMAEAGTAPAATLLVGDSAIDAETARRAGVAFCVARYGFGHDRGEVPVALGDIEVPHAEELADELDRWMAGASR